MRIGETIKNIAKKAIEDELKKELGISGKKDDEKNHQGESDSESKKDKESLEEYRRRVITIDTAETLIIGGIKGPIFDIKEIAEFDDESIFEDMLDSGEFQRIIKEIFSEIAPDKTLPEALTSNLGSILTEMKECLMDYIKNWKEEPYKLLDSKFNKNIAKLGDFVAKFNPNNHLDPDDYNDD